MKATQNIKAGASNWMYKIGAERMTGPRSCDKTVYDSRINNEWQARCEGVWRMEQLKAAVNGGTFKAKPIYPMISLKAEVSKYGYSDHGRNVFSSRSCFSISDIQKACQDLKK